ncbi:hypothetical protein [Persicobacter sp. CCB-QB2]|uniref:hypothetical protein n=1 Tax=Persicobacter sp. CCB-QB2 TaxID=1561025 RepID=UPI00345F8141
MSPKQIKLLEKWYRQRQEKTQLVEIIRLDAHLISLWQKYANLPYQIVEEKVLDWAFPSVTIDNNQLESCSGQQFKAFRNNIRYAQKNGCSIIPLNRENQTYLSGCVDLAKIWSKNQVKAQRSPMSYEELLAPYRYLLDHFFDLQIQGYCILLKNKVVAFNLLDTSLQQADTLVSLAFLAQRPQKMEKDSEDTKNSFPRGIPSYCRYGVSSESKKKGYRFISIGGSETGGLSHFKESLSTLPSLSLKTIRLL